jgi:acetyl-CoA C-acetyltransferase
MLREVYLAGAVRTAIGSFGGAFETVSATALGSAVVKAAIERAGVPASEVHEVIFGNVIAAGLGQNPARG